MKREAGEYLKEKRKKKGGTNDVNEIRKKVNVKRNSGEIERG